MRHGAISKLFTFDGLRYFLTWDVANDSAAYHSDRDLVPGLPLYLACSSCSTCIMQRPLWLSHVISTLSFLSYVLCADNMLRHCCWSLRIERWGQLLAPASSLKITSPFEN